MAAKTVKMCDMPIEVATKVFEMLNPGKVRVKVPDGRLCVRYFIITDAEPKDLTYPEGWYYAKGKFRNKHKSTTGVYHEVIMRTTDGKSWREIAQYCTLD